MAHHHTTVRFTLNEPIEADQHLIFGIPHDTPEQKVIGYSVSGVEQWTEIQAVNSHQSAILMTPLTNSQPRIDITFADDGTDFPLWIFRSTEGPHETPSVDLIKHIEHIAPSALSHSDRVEHIVRHVEERFTYGYRDVGLGDDVETMPALECDVHLGTCVDTHSYAVAAMRAAGIPAAYVSGVFFPQGQTISEPGHCWFVLDTKDAPHHWDISHYLKYNLGPVQPIFNPKPGVRYALSFGRDLVFEIDQHKIMLSRLSGFNLVNGTSTPQKMKTQATIL